MKKSSPKRREVKGFKTYLERANYLSIINPENREIYEAIAIFFGTDEIPPPPPRNQRD